MSSRYLGKHLALSMKLAKSKEIGPLLGSQPSINWLASFSKGKRIATWGRKKRWRLARKVANQFSMPLDCLEDGFISYLGHPALGDRRFSLVVDKTGIYYDATQPSDIENLLNNPADWMTTELQARSANLLELIRQYQVTKYNHEPTGSWAENCSLHSLHFHHPWRSKLEAGSQEKVLVVDQTYNDCSVKYGLANGRSFSDMLRAALHENPGAEVWVKVHPDVVLGKKKGYFELEPCGRKIKGFDSERIRVVADKVNAQSLFAYFEKVYVVTSQLGFEALWHKKEVVCFGAPFYSGWGLTDDRVKCSHRKQSHTIESLFAAACLEYTRYIDPETGERCELEAVIELIALQRQFQKQEVDTLYLVGFSLWKRGFLKNFLGNLARVFKFVKSAQQASSLAKPGDGVLTWGAKDYDYAPPSGVKLFRCEDAFIRGKGLGAELKRPQSLIVDRSGIYFDASRPSDLELAINTLTLSREQIERGAQLRKRLVCQRVSKYNLVGKHYDLFSSAKPGQQKLLVAGQVDSDASIKLGSLEIRSNLALLKRVREFAPGAYIVYKPHPDVVMAGRTGHIPEKEALQWADRVACDCDIFDGIAQCDELHVMTSLAGFEALLQEKKVHCWGTPFYSNWGLTVDHSPCNRRKAGRGIDELVYFAHCYYPRYINWTTRRFTTPERLLCSLEVEVQEVAQPRNPFIGWLGRTRRKAGYLLEMWRR